MSDPSNDRPAPAQPLEAAEQQQVELLDAYLALPPEQRLAARGPLLAEHPEIARLVECLDSLECLALPLARPPQGPAAASGLDETLWLDPEGSRPENGLAEVEPSGETAGFPRRFGKYELLAELGRGGMGVVYKARQMDLGRLVALKMILSSQLASPEEIRRFYEEAKAAGSLQHPHIVSIHEVGQQHDQHFFAMDYVAGQSLAEVLRDGILEPEVAVRWLLAIARAVHYLHGHGIVHRDLKPANILLDEQRQAYLTDFGLAKVFSAEAQYTRTGAIVGTPSYMAPEQAAGQTAEISPRTDVYGLGAILYEMLTGRPPFQESTPLDTLVQVLEGEPTLPCQLNRQIPEELQLICLQCLEKNPDERYGSAAELADDLEHYLKNEALDARPSRLTQRLRRWVRREPALVSHLAGLLVTALIVQVHYTAVPGDLPFHLQVMTLLGGWAIVSFACQQMLNQPRLAAPARFLWSGSDVVLLTTLLYLASAPLGPLLVGYPLLVAAAGLFFRVSLVSFVTALSILSYAGLLWLRPDEAAAPPHYLAIYAATLAVLGVMIGYQVHRVRALSRFYEHRRL